jgi:homocysteine S-methyltransferase
MKIRDYIKDNILLFDGALGSYSKEITNIDCDPEIYNLTNPQLIKNIHENYLVAGAKAIKTNTFMANKENYDNYAELITSGVSLAKQVASSYGAYVFSDIGQNMSYDYLDVVKVMISTEVNNYLFETLISLKGIKEATKLIKSVNKESYIIVSFSVNSDGYTKDGEYYLDLIKEANKIETIDSIGLNCSTGPFHLKNNLKNFIKNSKPIYISPNASYPVIINNRSRYQNNVSYFTDEMIEIVDLGADIIGGCCGTNPNYIKNLSLNLKNKNRVPFTSEEKESKESSIENTFMTKVKYRKKVIVVELDSPKIDDVNKFMESSKKLKLIGIDLLTIADNPLGYVRMSSSILACKVKRELDIEVMPHLTCRDRNINATKSLLLGLSIEGINNVLVITGDPLPSPFRNEVKSVYEFNSRKLTKYISNLNKTDFNNDFNIMCALNINSRNFDIQLKFAKEKIVNGAKVFLTQPILNENALINFKIAKRELNTIILAGIMPIVSYKNAVFINNEIPGINIDENIINEYKGLSREQSENLAFSISKYYIDELNDFVDGFYIMTPFNRINLVEKIVHYINKKNN